MRLIKSAAPVLAIALAVDVAASNLAPVEVSLFPFWNGRLVSLGLALLLALFAGYAVGAAFAMASARAKARVAAEEIARLNEIIGRGK
ncbi:hypothetical protein FACS1894186_7270 [Alphaproteobacteria bacterium]|nr:hypothetical protein FACS1894186_7270 [Alphaproteobacteria bacterium]